MRLQDYDFSLNVRRDPSLVDVLNDLKQLINNGRYQMRQVSTVPTHAGDEGEHLLYVSGTVRRLYVYDITNATWHYMEWDASGLGTTYFGDSTTDGTWRITPVGNNLSVQRREAGSWVEKSAYVP